MARKRTPAPKLRRASKGSRKQTKKRAVPAALAGGETTLSVLDGPMKSVILNAFLK